jgi:hypothetical protein
VSGIIFAGWEAAFPGWTLAFPGWTLAFPGWTLAFPGWTLAFPGWTLTFPGWTLFAALTAALANDAALFAATDCGPVAWFAAAFALAAALVALVIRDGSIGFPDATALVSLEAALEATLAACDAILFGDVELFCDVELF